MREDQTPKAIEDNARFFENKEEIPKFAITMGVGTIMEAKECLLLASGKNKAESGSPDWTMLITNPPCFGGCIEWLSEKDDVRAFFEFSVKDIEIPALGVPA